MITKNCVLAGDAVEERFFGIFCRGFGPLTSRSPKLKVDGLFYAKILVLENLSRTIILYITDFLKSVKQISQSAIFNYRLECLSYINHVDKDGAMETTEIKKGFGGRLKELRKQKKWTQKEMASKVSIGFSQFNKYECGLYLPPAEKLILLAELLDTTIDYLLIGNNADVSPLHSMRLLERFRALEKFKTDDREAVIKLIDAMIVKQKVEGALKDTA